MAGPANRIEAMSAAVTAATATPPRFEAALLSPGVRSAVIEPRLYQVAARIPGRDRLRFETPHRVCARRRDRRGGLGWRSRDPEGRGFVEPDRHRALLRPLGRVTTPDR